jgi:hypothetical protein
VSVGNREQVKVRGGSGCGGGGEREDGLIKHHMTRDEDPTRGKVKTTVTLVIRGVPEEDTESRTGCQLVGSGGYGVRVTHTRRLGGDRTEQGYRKERGEAWELGKQRKEDG